MSTTTPDPNEDVPTQPDNPEVEQDDDVDDDDFKPGTEPDGNGPQKR